MKKIKEKIVEITNRGMKFGESMQPPATKEQVEILDKQFYDLYGFRLPETYKSIVQIINGFNEDGVFLYGTERALLVGYTDRFLDGIIYANEGWHDDEDFAKHIFYADYDIYLFVQNIETKLFSFHPRDGFEEVLLETSDEELFFEIILDCALGTPIEEKYGSN